MMKQRDIVAFINEAFDKLIKQRDPSSRIVQHNPHYMVEDSSMQRLKPGKWLNDELINAYASLVNQRIAKQTNYSIMCMNTWFMT